MRFLALAAFLFVANTSFAQGKLDQVRDEVEKSSSSSSKSDDRCNDDSNSLLSDTSNAAAGTGSSVPTSGGGISDLDLGAAIFAFPWVLPHMALDPGLDVRASFQPYPFASPAGAMFLFGGDRRANFDEEPKWYSIRASIEAGSDFDGLTRVGTKLFLDTDTRFGLKANWDYFSEKLDCGGTDSLWIGDITATFRFVQNDWLQMHTGLGARFLIDGGDDRAGINFLYGFDAFPVHGVHLFGTFEAGNIRRAGVWRVQSGVGYLWQRGEIFAGYDYFNIGGVELKGPFAGLRLWF